MITLHNHAGTHVDAPAHFISGGRPISDYSLDELIFENPMLIGCPKTPGGQIGLGDISTKKLEDIDCLLLRTGFGRFRKKDPETYRTQNPGITPEAIQWIRKEHPRIRCIGVDSISISAFQDREQGREAHKTAFKKEDYSGEPLLIIEDMKLSAITTHDKLKKVLIIPWQISGIDSAPCVVLAEVV